jgi:uncharacterized protein
MTSLASLPTFRYHPDPIGSGSVVAAPTRCRACGEARGHVYVGPVYAEDDLEDALCPWCIADGTAHVKFDASFVDVEAFASGTADYVVDEIAQRTPGFSAWQTERWPSCCGEPAAFLEPAGIAEIRARYRRVESELVPYIVHVMGISGGAAIRTLESLRRDTSPTAFVFRCLHCDTYPAYVDSL